MTKKTNDLCVVAKNVKDGDLMSFTLWAKVKKASNGGTVLNLVNVDNGTEFDVQGEVLVEQALSADQAATTKTLARRDVVEVLIEAKRVPFTVAFTKADGNRRVLRGRLIGVREANLGYIDVEDLDKPVGDRFRQVDARSIEFVVVGNVKYVVK